jgi:hypothetical protein
MMSRVFNSAATGAVIYVFTNDHCPPHVHARHRSEDWIARLRFSYLSHEVKLMSITPARNVPLQRVINELLGELRDRLSDCRESWWLTTQTACLANQWARVSAAGKVELLAERKPGAKQITEATYVHATERLQVVFQDGTTTEVRLR